MADDATKRPLWRNQRLLHVRTLGDGFWGVFTPLSDGVRMLARCGGEHAEANARRFAEAWNHLEKDDCQGALH